MKLLRSILFHQTVKFFSPVVFIFALSLSKAAANTLELQDVLSAQPVAGAGLSLDQLGVELSMSGDQVVMQLPKNIDRLELNIGSHPGLFLTLNDFDGELVVMGENTLKRLRFNNISKITLTGRLNVKADLVFDTLDELLMAESATLEAQNITAIDFGHIKVLGKVRAKEGFLARGESLTIGLHGSMLANVMIQLMLSGDFFQGGQFGSGNLISVSCKDRSHFSKESKTISPRFVLEVPFFQADEGAEFYVVKRFIVSALTANWFGNLVVTNNDMTKFKAFLSQFQIANAVLESLLVTTPLEKFDVILIKGKRVLKLGGGSWVDTALPVIFLSNDKTIFKDGLDFNADQILVATFLTQRLDFSGEFKGLVDLVLNPTDKKNKSRFKFSQASGINAGSLSIEADRVNMQGRVALDPERGFLNVSAKKGRMHGPISGRSATIDMPVNRNNLTSQMTMSSWIFLGDVTNESSLLYFLNSSQLDSESLSLLTSEAITAPKDLKVERRGNIFLIAGSLDLIWGVAKVTFASPLFG
jgi:hypothetical protein